MQYCYILQVASTSAVQPTTVHLPVAQCLADQQHSAGQCTPQVYIHTSVLQIPWSALSTILHTNAVLLHCTGG